MVLNVLFFIIVETNPNTMKNNLLLTVANIFCKVMGAGTVLSFVILSAMLVYWHVDPEFYKSYLFLVIFKIYGPDTFLGYTITETWTIADTVEKSPFSFAHIKRFSLYFIYLQSAALLWCFFLVFKEAVNIITSVKLQQSFRIENFKSFKKMGRYFFSIFCLSSFYFVNSEYGNFYGLYVHLTPLILMMGSYIIAEIFREGNILQEEVQQTI